MSLEYRSEQERLVAEQAVLAFRATQAAMASAVHGQGLAVTEAAVLEHGRALLQKMLSEALSTHPEVQKGGPALGRARAPETPPSSTTHPRRSSP
jgi:hypothetical protein